MVLTGHYLFNATTYSINIKKPLMVGFNHCDDCQRATGSAYLLAVAIPKDKVTLTEPTKRWTGKGTSGKPVHRIFCSECGSPIMADAHIAVYTSTVS
ncbi:hypothetical protein DPV78_011334 [Talaromyces pinophilus]|nr:hypothetical protein DPV78_011334 [Talaromyces pinophilus]